MLMGSPSLSRESGRGPTQHQVGAVLRIRLEAAPGLRLMELRSTTEALLGSCGGATQQTESSAARGAVRGSAVTGCKSPQRARTVHRWPTFGSNPSVRTLGTRSPPSSSATTASSAGAGAHGSTISAATSGDAPASRATGRSSAGSCTTARRTRRGRLRRRPSSRLVPVRAARGVAQHPPPQGVRGRLDAAPRLPADVHLRRSRLPASRHRRVRVARRTRAHRHGRRRSGRGLSARHRGQEGVGVVPLQRHPRHVRTLRVRV